MILTMSQHIQGQQFSYNQRDCHLINLHNVSLNNVSRLSDLTIVCLYVACNSRVQPRLQNLLCFEN